MKRWAKSLGAEICGSIGADHLIISFWVQVLSTYLWQDGKMMIDATHMMNLHLQQLSP